MTQDFKSTFEHMISGHMADGDIVACLKNWEADSITEMQLAIAAGVLRSCMTTVKAPKGALDIVGTGGDGLSTYNISTAAAIVTASAGVPVAKHGSRAVSSKSGASDVLRALGVKLDIDTARTEMCLEDAGLAFLFAPNHHEAMGHVAKARAMMGTRSIFNLLGPLCNPAGVRHLVLGVYDDGLREIYAKALAKLGVSRALVVHGGDGMDEITATAPTMVSEINGTDITQYQITPEQYGMQRASLTDLEGGDPEHNAWALTKLLGGQRGAYRDIVVLNAGAALYAARKVDSIMEGVEKAGAYLSYGGAQETLKSLVQVSNG